MPIKIHNDIPVKSILEKENIFVMDETRSMTQDIRPIEIGILNLMPLKEDTELHLLRSLANTPIQVDVHFISVSSHEARHTTKSHLDTFYHRFSDIKDWNLDGLIITGAPVELMEFEKVDYWEEFKEIIDWTDSHVTSTLHLCWGAQAGLYHRFGINKRILDKKVFGVFEHDIKHRWVPLVRGFDDVFRAPHSRHTDIDLEALRKIDEVTILAESKEVGMLICMTNDGRNIYNMGHLEYDRVTLQKEYMRDADRDDVLLPKNYFPNDDPSKDPLLTWRAHGNTFYTNWLNYYVYQATPYDFIEKGARGL